jgi:hypothetical protein
MHRRFKHFEYVGVYYNKYDCNASLIATNVNYHFSSLKNAEQFSNTLKRLTQDVPFVVDHIIKTSETRSFYTVPVTMRIANVARGWTAYNTLAIMRNHGLLPQTVMAFFPSRNWQLETLTYAFQEPDKLFPSLVLKNDRIDLFKLPYIDFLKAVSSEVPECCVTLPSFVAENSSDDESTNCLEKNLTRLSLSIT